MKNVYSDLLYKKEIHSAGITQINIVPREWLTNDPIIDFETGQVLIAPTLDTDRVWLVADLTTISYDYSETPKQSKSGDYYEINASGFLNTLDYTLQQVLETLRYNDFVADITDRNKRRKLVGDTKNGMKLTVTHTHKNAPTSEERVQISLFAQLEYLPPFYSPALATP